MMRTAIVICVLALSLHCALCNIDAAGEKCKQELDYKGQAPPFKLEGASKEDKCYLRCVLESTGALKKDGSIDVEAGKASFAPVQRMEVDVKEKIFKAIEECAKEVKPKGDDLCEIAYQYYQCAARKFAASYGRAVLPLPGLAKKEQHPPSQLSNQESASLSPKQSEDSRGPSEVPFKKISTLRRPSKGSEGPGVDKQYRPSKRWPPYLY